jgi:aminoglycoside phosphotransferase (APT) family kinase protein
MRSMLRCYWTQRGEPAGCSPIRPLPIAAAPGLRSASPRRAVALTTPASNARQSFCFVAVVVAITSPLVRDLVAEQFPVWAELPIEPVELQGWDNRTFRLGEELTVRLPSAEAYAAQIEKEHRWLPILAPRLRLPIPRPIALGSPTPQFPWPWSIRRWLPGRPADRRSRFDPRSLADDLGTFLMDLQGLDATGGPPPGNHNFFRGGPLNVYSEETLEAISVLPARTDHARAHHIWNDALEAHWDQSPVWVHGDVTPSNLLILDGRLGGVIDFGSCAVGDPACDLAIGWTAFTARERDALQSHAGVDDAHAAGRSGKRSSPSKEAFAMQNRHASASGGAGQPPQSSSRSSTRATSSEFANSRGARSARKRSRQRIFSA